MMVIEKLITHSIDRKFDVECEIKNISINFDVCNGISSISLSGFQEQLIDSAAGYLDAILNFNFEEVSDQNLDSILDLSQKEISSSIANKPFEVASDQLSQKLKTKHDFKIDEKYLNEFKKQQEVIFKSALASSVKS